jgi:hypothetical protein
MLAGALGSQQAEQSAQAQNWGNLGGNLLGASAGLFGQLNSGPATSDTQPGGGNNYATSTSPYGY